jgi:hypothetical protein
MTKTHAASIAVALGLLALSGSSFQAAARSNGIVTRPVQPTKSAPKSTPASRPVRSEHRATSRAFGVAWAPYPYYGAPDYLSGDLVDATVSPPEPMLTCKRSQQTVTVPSWDGGTKEVRVTRC